MLFKNLRREWQTYKLEEKKLNMLMPGEEILLDDVVVFVKESIKNNENKYNAVLAQKLEPNLVRILSTQEIVRISEISNIRFARKLLQLLTKKAPNINNLAFGHAPNANLNKEKDLYVLGCKDSHIMLYCLFKDTQGILCRNSAMLKQLKLLEVDINSTLNKFFSKSSSTQTHQPKL